MYTIELDSSDYFINTRSVKVNDWSRLVHEVQSHGLLGQSWSENRRGKTSFAVEGTVDDYAELSNDIWGLQTVYNKFAALKSSPEAVTM